jgi:hypothetical protein
MKQVKLAQFPLRSPYGTAAVGDCHVGYKRKNWILAAAGCIFQI